MESNVARPYTAVYACIEQSGKLLMARRYNTGYCDGQYSLPAGKCDEGESLTTALQREMAEELGIIVEKEHLELAHVCHRKDEHTWVDVFFLVREWKGTLTNNEPHKCDDMQYVSWEELPENTIPYVRSILKNIQQGIVYSELDWE